MNVKFTLAFIAVFALVSTPETLAAKSTKNSGRAPNTITVPAPALITEERSATATEDNQTVRNIEKIKEKVETNKKDPLAYRTMMLLHNVLSRP
ncbi:MAG TPA: hypothetical protein V6C97_34165 [Oculatellaceae cyanobacterium]